MITRKIPLPLVVVKDDAVTLSGNLGARLIDCYPANVGGQIVIRKRPGLDLFKDLGVTNKIDGLAWWDKNEVMLSTAGGDVYKTTDADGTTENVSGTDKLNSGVITSFAIANANAFMIMANGGRMLKYDNSTDPSFIADVDAPTNVDQVGFLNTRILAKKSNSPNTHFSDVSDSTSWAASSTFQPESKPDDSMIMAVTGNEILEIGKETTETWYDTGNSLAPFRVMKAATLSSIGTLARNSFQDMEGSFIWLDQKRRFIRVDGRAPRDISTLIARELTDITPVSDAIAMGINYQDNSFYVCNFPTGNKTFAYDVKRDVFVEWGSWNENKGDWDEFICNTHAFSPLWDKNILGSAKTGKLYVLNKDTFQDDGATIRSLIQTSPIDHGTSKRKRCYKITLRFKRGVGTISANEPKFQMRFSNEGREFSNWRNGSLGKLGDNQFFVRFRQLGSYIARQWQFAHAENSDFVLTDIEEELDLAEF